MTAFSSVSPGQSLHWPPPCPVSRGNPSVRLESNKNEYFSRHREFILDIFQVRRTFSTPSWRDHHDTWKEQRYNWLPSWKDIPKHLHDPLDSSHLQNLSVSNIYYREAAVTHFIVFTKWSVVKSAQNYRIFVTSIQNSPTIILLFQPANWLNYAQDDIILFHSLSTSNSLKLL